jgi:Flp pilus assembly protein TadD
VFLRSGTTERWQTTLGNFERTWSRSDHWALVVLPPGRIPASAQPGPYLQAVHALEGAGQAVAAEAAWRAATRHWPDDPRAHLALGNNRYAAADYPGATIAFREAARLDPVNPQAWNNLAYALLQTACPQQAVAAAACAASLAADDENYRNTLEEVSKLASGIDGAHCPALDCPAVAP